MRVGAVGMVGRDGEESVSALSVVEKNDFFVDSDRTRDQRKKLIADSDSGHSETPW